MKLVYKSCMYMYLNLKQTQLEDMLLTINCKSIQLMSWERSRNNIFNMATFQSHLKWGFSEFQPDILEELWTIIPNCCRIWPN